MIDEYREEIYRRHALQKTAHILSLPYPYLNISVG
jgi:hypothetical protein